MHGQQAGTTHAPVSHRLWRDKVEAAVVRRRELRRRGRDHSIRRAVRAQDVARGQDRSGGGAGVGGDVVVNDAATGVRPAAVCQAPAAGERRAVARAVEEPARPRRDGGAQRAPARTAAEALAHEREVVPKAGVAVRARAQPAVLRDSTSSKNMKKKSSALLNTCSTSLYTSSGTTDETYAVAVPTRPWPPASHR